MDKEVKVTLSCNEDPGYLNTSKMVSTAALCLALDKSKFESCTDSVKPLKGGVLTCSAALGHYLVQRLLQGVLDIEVDERN